MAVMRAARSPAWIEGSCNVKGVLLVLLSGITDLVCGHLFVRELGGSQIF